MNNSLQSLKNSLDLSWSYEIFAAALRRCCGGAVAKQSCPSFLKALLKDKTAEVQSRRRELTWWILQSKHLIMAGWPSKTWGMFKFRSTLVNQLLNHAKLNSETSIESEVEQPQHSQHEVIFSDKRPLTARRPSSALLASKRKHLQAMLMRLKKANLEVLLSAIESGIPGKCVLLPASTSRPHFTFSQVFRWPDLQFERELKRLSYYCQTPETSSKSPLEPKLYECCNPYHWTRLLIPPHITNQAGKFCVFYKKCHSAVLGLDGAKKHLALARPSSACDPYLCTLEQTVLCRS